MPTTKKGKMGSATKTEEMVVVPVQEEAKAETRTGKVVGEKPKATRRLRSTRDNEWYLKHEGDFELVTSEATNAKLGINMIYVFEPTEKQYENGVLAGIRLETVIGQINSIQVREGKDGKSIYLSEPSRNIAKEGENARWMNDVRLDRKVQAQVLSYVSTLLIEA